MTRELQLLARAIVACAVASIAVFAQTEIAPARYLSGSLPAFSLQAIAAGEVRLSVDVTDAGAVAAIDVLRATPPFTDAVVSVVRGWRFTPAADPLGRPLASRVLVVAVIGPPSLMVPTVGDPPKDVAAPGLALPWPVNAPPPIYPFNARSGGTVMLETRIAASGRVVGVTALRSAPRLDDAAMEAARAWTFRPPQGADVAPSPYAYLIFEFKPPLVGLSPKK